MIHESIKCDCCGTELIQDTSYPAQYALRLQAINVNRNTSGIVYAVACYPPYGLEREREFCNYKCLREWLENNNAK